jgi:hypothetical protein
VTIARPSNVAAPDDLLVALHKLHESHKSWVNVAKVLGVSQSFLCDLLKGRRQPGTKVLEKLGLQKRVEYVRS